MPDTLSVYSPQPVDTRAVFLSEPMLSLTEKLAENAHELWAKERMAQGWTWGPKRDDALKHHPCLIPYDQLGEDEKQMDRETALGTLKAVLALGYRIEDPGTASAPVAAPLQDDSLQRGVEGM